MLTAHIDANWARTACDRRSTSGEVFTHVNYQIKVWSKTQSFVALSSTESDLYALVKARAEAMGFQSVIRDLRQSWSTLVYSDASQRRLWYNARAWGDSRVLQFVVRAELERAEGRAPCEERWGSDDSVDICTKVFNAELTKKHVSAMDGRFSAGRTNGKPKNLLECWIQCETALGRGTQLSSAVC